MRDFVDALDAAIRPLAQREILTRFKHTSAHAKRDGSLITAADLAMQECVTALLAKLDPGTPVLGEEMTEAAQQHLFAQDQARFWALDPLDGTSNYVCGFPYFALSLALIESGAVTLGLVYDPVRDECFHAVRGAGAWCNGEKLQPFAASERLADGLAMMDLKRVPGSALARLLAPTAFRSQRNLGSVALDWCWLAAGRYQLYLHGGQRLWDYAAGRLIASEAGVSSQLYDPASWQVPTRLELSPRLALAAATAPLFEQWQHFVALPWQSGT